MPTRPVFLVVLVGMAISTLPVMAEISFITQTRWVSASTGYYDAMYNEVLDSEDLRANDFLEFQADPQAAVSGYGNSAAAQAHHHSVISSGGFVFSGFGSAAVDTNILDCYFFSGIETHFAVYFMIDTATEFELTGWYRGNEAEAADFYFYTSLTGSFNISDRNADYAELHERGTLQPGYYTFTVHSTSSANTNLTPPSPGSFDFAVELRFLAPSPVAEDGDAPHLSMSPNPFSGSTSIAFTPERLDSPVSLDVYDLRGRRVCGLLDSGMGGGVRSWNGRDSHGQKAAPGVYFIVLRNDDFVQKRKITLIR